MESDAVGERLEVSLDRCYWDVPVTLPERRFNAFSRKLDRQLHQLVKRWAHAAAPHGSQFRRQRDGSTIVGPTPESGS